VDDELDFAGVECKYENVDLKVGTQESSIHNQILNFDTL
jgi:hypothetical protein